MVSEIHIENFKSYKRATLPLAPLTLMIGANASGKSNAIEGIRFLSWLAEGRRLDDILDKVQQTDIAIRGSLDNLIYDGAKADRITLGCMLENVDEWKQFSITMKIEEQKHMRVIEEHIRSNSTTVPLYEIKHPAEGFSREVQVAYNNFARGGRKPILPCSDRQAIFTQLDIPSRFNEGPAREVIPEVVLTYQETLKQVLFLDPNPRRMSAYSFIIDKELRGDGANLSSTLYSVCEEQRRKGEILKFIRSLPEQDIVDIRFVKTERNEVLVQLVESFAGHERLRDASVLSDGTLRILAVAAALLSGPEGSLVIIEEIDNGVHPSRAEMLLRNIQDVAQQRNLRVLLTSHNPALLDTLPLAAIPHVVCCYRDPEEGDSRLIRLQDLRSYPELVARGPLGQLMTKGILDKYLKNQRTAEEQKDQSQDWLNELRLQVAES